MLNKKLNIIALVGFFILIAVLSRLVSHAWNFTILGGLAVFSGSFFTRKSISVFIMLLSLLISDLFLGFHNQMPAVYFSFLVMIFLGSFLSIETSRFKIITTTLFGSFLFFAVTNFSVWYGGTLYPQTTNGLIDCYLMGLPFYRNQLVSDIVSVVVFFELARSLKSFLVMRFDQKFIKV